MPARRHGRSGTPVYSVWCAMVRRCTEPRAADFNRYGGRGIRVCDRWRTFENFLADMGERPSLKHSIERIDNDGDYEPGNVKWATRIEQANNKRTTHLVTYRGVEMSIADAARAGWAGVPRETVTCRLRNGWTIEEAVETPYKRWRHPPGCPDADWCNCNSVCFWDCQGDPDADIDREIAKEGDK